MGGGREGHPEGKGRWENKKDAPKLV